MKSIFLILSFITLHSMEDQKGYPSKENSNFKQITFNGEKKALMAFVQEAQENPSHPFAQTRIIQWDDETNAHKEIGTVATIDESSSLEIFCNNCRYIGHYKTEKIHGWYTPIPAILVGTNDKQIADAIILFERLKLHQNVANCPKKYERKSLLN